MVWEFKMKEWLNTIICQLYDYMNLMICRLFGHKVVKSRDGLRWLCVRCEDEWLVELHGTLAYWVDKWLDDEAFIRTDIP